MNSWRSRIAVAVGAAAIALPLAAGSASAAGDPPVKDRDRGSVSDQWGYIPVGGTHSQAECAQDGLELLAQGRYANFYCAWEAPLWTLYALPHADRPPTRP